MRIRRRPTSPYFRSPRISQDRYIRASVLWKTAKHTSEDYELQEFPALGNLVRRDGGPYYSTTTFLAAWGACWRAACLRGSVVTLGQTRTRIQTQFSPRPDPPRSVPPRLAA
ncbi:hypothetical protein E2C01_077340 [Portunus trituberculatus]|uniref:Uncharacterized protein n=1 Tax=Portunus trituberculatus TaxID=210409 RepID=A0A5B7IFU0_PORTR|nr:hypothetical protein [Portunus trituberculatus]